MLPPVFVLSHIIHELIHPILQKKKERESAVMKNRRLTEEQREKWLKVMTNDFMSSEESGEEDSINIRRLPWRSQYVDSMFKKIDSYSKAKKSSQAKRQLKVRRVSHDPSARLAPVGAPEWSLQ